MSKIAVLKETVQLKIDGNLHEFPSLVGTENERAIDIDKLRDKTGYVTLDSGFKNTASTTSAITFLDGEEGILRYRGYPIEQLASQASFLEVSYLLIYGELPTQAQLDAFEAGIRANTMVPEAIQKMLDAFPVNNSHPMGMLSSVTGALHAFHPESLDPFRSEEMKNQTVLQLMGKLPIMAAWIYRRLNGMNYTQPNPAMEYCANFLEMTFSGAPGYKPDPVVAQAVNVLLILHADHEQNCSTSTVRMVGSSQANLFGSVSAGINALWGPLHGGANQSVIEMLEAIKDDGGDTTKWLNKAKDKDDPFRLMGFGHRVYKNFDPRATIIKKAADDVLRQLGIKDPVLDIAKGLEEVALSDSYFKDRKLFPNVDFYSGIIYRALGIPVNMFTVMFALGRLPGWIAQWRELIQSNEPIGRPRQIYTGYPTRDFVPMKNR